MRPIVLLGQPPQQKPKKYQLIRKARSTAESEIPLAVVSPRYRALQNSEAFEFFDPIVGKNAAVFETADHWVTANGFGYSPKYLVRCTSWAMIAAKDTCSFPILTMARVR